MAFVILSGGTTSNSLTHTTGLMTIFGPAALTNAVAVEVSSDNGVTWNALVDLGVAVTIAATKATVIQGNYGLVRVKSAGAEGATRTFPTLTTRSGSRRASSTNVLVTPLVENLDAGTKNITNAGTVAATSLTGALTGDVTGNVTGNTTGTHTGTVAVAAGGATITTGAGAPAAAAPNGSLYLRSGGAADTTLYARIGGAWVPVKNA